MLIDAINIRQKKQKLPYIRCRGISVAGTESIFYFFSISVFIPMLFFSQKKKFKSGT